MLVQKDFIISLTVASVHLNKENLSCDTVVRQLLSTLSAAKEKDTIAIYIAINAVILTIVLNQIISLILELNYLA
jgi:hypothetical protein